MDIVNQTWAVALLLMVSIGGACAVEQPAVRAPAGAVAVGAPAPALAAATLDGTKLDLASLRGQVVVVDFWASWCEPCRRELPALEAIYRGHKDRGLQMVGVSIDEQRADAEAFLREQVQLTFPIVHDAGQALAGAWAPPKMPTLYVIDREGKVARIFAGEVPGQLEQIEDEVVRLLGS